MTIKKATQDDIRAAATLAHQLWPGDSPEEHAAALLEIIASPEAAVFLAMEQGNACAFAQCQLRHDYVEGTDSSPVGYLEGIYVCPACQRRGIARELLAACENWARAVGCTEFASDCELDNEDSLRFHLHTGFTEANRIICFTKRL